MIPVQFDYVAPENLETAVKLLHDNAQAQILANSYSLIAALTAGNLHPSLLIDLGKINGLEGIEQQADGGLKINALTTYAQVAGNSLIKQAYLALAEAAESIGDAQIRNWQGIGDVFAYRDLACDLPAVALVLEATYNVVGSEGNSTISADLLISKLFPANWQLKEIVTSINLPKPTEGTGSAYQTFKNPANRYTLCGLAAFVQRAASSNTITECRVAVTGATPYPMRLTQVEATLQGTTPTAENLTAAAQLARESIATNLIGDRYASADYRQHLVGVLTKRTLTLALERAGFLL